MKSFIEFLLCGLLTLFAPGATAEESDGDKTLVTWVYLGNLSQQGGSALTIQRGEQFDAIVFGELNPGKWMAGSDNFQRTQHQQDEYAAERADPQTMVQIAAVYGEGRIRIYRDGELYADYEAAIQDFLSDEYHFAVFGLRHVGAATGGLLIGGIEDARVYAQALSQQQIESLRPNIASEIAPLAWWDFEGGGAKEKTGHFPHHVLMNGARVADGQLLLDGTGYMIATRSEQGIELAKRGQVPSPPYVPETPAWPEHPPAHWLTFHLAHPGPGPAMPGDPNCIFDYKGRYHLHYIYRNHTGFVFAHVSSKDMVHWDWHPTVLAPPSTGHGMFSGTGFYTKDGKPAIIYHGQGSGRNWIQYPLDEEFNSWSDPVVVLPKTADGQIPDIRHWDPDCWIDGDTYYALSGGQNPQLMKSTDLENWAYLGVLLHEDYPKDLGVPKEEDISCANMFQIGDKWMLLCISHTLGCRYYLGDFKDEKFLPESHAMMSFIGQDNQFFAPESMLTRDGRRVMWAWQLGLPEVPTGVQSLPRELELPEDGVLRIRPIRELASLRYDERSWTQRTIEEGDPYVLEDLTGDALELQVSLNPLQAAKCGVQLAPARPGAEPVHVILDVEGKTLNVGKVKAPFELRPGENLELRVFVDKNLVEVFANDRQAVAAWCDLSSEDLTVSLSTQGGPVEIEAVKAWKMKSIY